MNENSTQPPMMKEGGKSRGILVAVIIIAIIALGFFAFMNKSNDAGKDSMMKDTEAMMKDDGAAMKKDSEAMMEKSAAMMAYTVKYTNAGFVPTALEIKAGETVTFVNESDTDMWVASAIHPTHELLPEFDQKAGTLKGSKYSFTFNTPGIWKFHNHLNPATKGSVTVK